MRGPEHLTVVKSVSEKSQKKSPCLSAMLVFFTHFETQIDHLVYHLTGHIGEPGVRPGQRSDHVLKPAEPDSGAVNRLEKQIGHLVYQLYQLTDQEIAIVEARTN